MDEELIRLAERYRQLNKEAGDWYGSKGLYLYIAGAGGLMTLGSILFPGGAYANGEHPMFILGVGFCCLLGAGIYYLVRNDQDKRRQTEIDSIQRKFSHRKLSVHSDGSISPS